MEVYKIQIPNNQSGVSASSQLIDYIGLYMGQPGLDYVDTIHNFETGLWHHIYNEWAGSLSFEPSAHNTINALAVYDDGFGDVIKVFYLDDDNKIKLLNY